MIIQELDFQNVEISRLGGYDGFKVSFSINHQGYILLAGKQETLFPLSIKHAFIEKEKCQFCNKLVLKSAISQQICLHLILKKGDLLTFFQQKYPEQFE
ncbi:hypothetical protein CN692_00310 [Bacillus sp. AFS002410]|uniref:hypothetical protein n=1 Tax=Bacillus sp. AFS002410 TaxID=2033481 RepID=UPI000BF05947|nr:hypothetical protein [Bacillus sp. AFS002410]PEJ60569.1 hypothetical protein CN692_00310 [Bacillus sp. AFS002410]